MYILNIETSTKNCSVSLAKNGKTIICKELSEAGFSHAEKLHIFIENVLKSANLSFKDLNAIAVSQGPGSYTGLRIGVSAAKGLCYALDIPLIAVDTLQVLASKADIKNGIIIPMIDARRMEVYSSIFDENHNKIREIKAEILDENSFQEIQETIYFVGDCNEKAKTVLTKNNYVFLDDKIYPSANEMSLLSFNKFQNKNFEDVAYFEPYYLKDFITTVSKKL
jgi:tRNA threonylcarbamoyladenosine biosynthesis protein TsaB